MSTTAACWSLLACACVCIAGAPVADQSATSANAHPAVSPDGHRLLFDSDRTGGGDIYVMDADGSNVTRLTRDPAMEMGALWWDAGRSVVFQRSVPRSRRPDVLIMDADGGRVRLLDEPRAIHWAWSRDGAQMLTGPLASGEPPLIWIQNVDGSARRLLTSFRDDSFNSDMSFSPDGTRVVFESFIKTMDTAGIYLVGTGGGAAIRIADGTDPGWSPDGRRIAFKVHSATDVYELFVCDADGGHRRSLGPGTYPRWFPDSRRLAAMALVDGSYQIVVVDVDSGVRQVLTR